MDLKQRLLSGEKRAGARLISLVENKQKEAIDILKHVYNKTGNAYIIGITGPPGAGKSTLTDKLVKEIRKTGKTVGIIAVDPTSPYTGGAILGDRVRMSDISTDPGVFIRSMGARGHLGGISSATSSAIQILDIMGYDYVFVETVGVGQSEIDIVKNCDTTLMVMVPGLGDDIQAIKAGVMEIGDVFAVNKSDRDGAKRTAREIDMMLDFSKSDWRPPVTMVTAIKNEGIIDLLETVYDHRNYLIDSGEFENKRKKNVKSEIIEMIKEQVMIHMFDDGYNEDMIETLTGEVAKRSKDPYTASEEILKGLKIHV